LQHLWFLLTDFNIFPVLLKSEVIGSHTRTTEAFCW